MGELCQEIDWLGMDMIVTLQVASVVADDITRNNAESLAHFFELSLDDIAVRLLNRLDCENDQVLKLERSSQLPPMRQPDPDDQETLDLSQLDRVVDDECPVGGDFLGTIEFIETDSQNPILSGVGSRACPSQF